MDSFIYALVLSPALTELLPKSGMANTHENVGLVGSVLFALSCNFLRKVCGSGREFFNRCNGSSCWDNRETCSLYSYRLRAWAADHSVRAGNPERTVAGLKGI